VIRVTALAVAQLRLLVRRRSALEGSLRPRKPKPVASGQPASEPRSVSGAAGAVELAPSVALSGSCPDSADDGRGIMNDHEDDGARQTPLERRRSPNPKKNAKATGAEGGGATVVPVPPSAALGPGVPD
jgi:hypothetical protein